MIYTILVLISRYAVPVFGVKVEGIDNIPGEGSLIVVANHLDGADGGATLATLRRRIVFLLKEDLVFYLKFVLKWAGSIILPRPKAERKGLLRFFDTLMVTAKNHFPWLPIRKRRAPLAMAVRTASALRKARRLLQTSTDCALVMFPEGTREKCGLQKAEPGAGAIALQNRNIPIVPAAITGTKGFLRLPWAPLVIILCLLRLRKISIRYGPAFCFLPTVTDPQEAANFMMERIAELLPPKWRGVYANTEG